MSGRRSRSLRVGLVVLALVALAPLARAETIRTKNGQRLEGEIVGESAAEVVLRTRYGVLVIPTAAIASIEGRATASAPAPAPSVAAVDQVKVRALRLKARRLTQTNKTEAALAAYVELLWLDPDDVPALVEVCALRAQLGQAPEAVAALRHAILSGFTDVEALLRDPRLAKVAGDPALEQLVRQRAGLLRIAGRKAGARVIRSLRARGATATYREVASEALQLVYVHALDDSAFAAVRAEVEAFVGLARRDLLRGAPEGALVLALLADEDRAVLGEVAASHDPATSTLTCAPFPFGTLSRAPAAQKELARALLAADQQARRLRHPAWLEEGLVELLGSVAVVESRLVPRDVKTTPDAAPLGGLLGLGRADLDKRGRSARAGARSLVHYLWTRGALARVYEQVAAGDESSAIATLEELLGEPAAKIDAAWRAWLAAQPAPVVPFTGLVTTRTDRGLRVTYVQPESGAARGHLVEADVVIAIDGLPIRSDDDLNDALGARAIGDEVEVTVVRNEATLRGRVKLSARPPGPIGPMRDEAPYLGIAVEQAASGVTIKSVDVGSPAAKADLRAGDLLVSLDGLEVPTVRAWLRALRQKQAGQQGALLVERAGEKVTVDVELAPLGQ